MRRFYAALIIAVLASAAPASDDAARAVVEKAIEAHGGAARLFAQPVVYMKLHGTVCLPPGSPAVPVIIEDWRKVPEHYITFVQLERDGKKVLEGEALVGKGGAVFNNGVSRQMSKELAAEMRARKEATDLDRLDFFNDKDCEITSIPDTKVDGHDAAGVLVKPKGRREVKLFFDKETGLLVKREHKMVDHKTQNQGTQETIFSDYCDVDGVKRYQAVKVYRDGKKFLEATVTERSLVDKPRPPVPPQFMDDSPPRA